MSDPAQDPAHDLTERPQDARQPRIRLGTFLALMRVLAGHRGHARATWNRFGFTYLVVVVREAQPVPMVELEADPEALGGAEALARLLDALTQPE